MPAVVPFIPLISAAVGAAGTGFAIDSAVNSGPSGPTPQQQAATAQAQQLAQQKAAFLSNQATQTTPTLGTSGLTGPSTTPGLTPTQPGSTTQPAPADLQALLAVLNPVSSGISLSGGIS